MASANVVQFTDSTFDRDVINSPCPVLVDFWAEWCMPCRALSPTINALADQFAGKVVVGKVDTESNRGVSVKYGITAIPTVMLFVKGQIVKRFVGLRPKDEIAQALTEALGQ